MTADTQWIDLTPAGDVIVDDEDNGGNDGGSDTRPSGTLIPLGAKYTPNGGTALIGNNTNTFPDTVQTGDKYEEGDYVYTYNKGNDYGSNWSVVVKDTSKTTYDAIISEIAGKPMTNMYCTFYGCNSLATAPTIPSSVTNMDSTFWDCTSLTAAPAIPNGVTNMYWTFANCTSLTTAPTIPNSVTNMYCTFWDCTSLTGTIEVNANIDTSSSYNYDKCFYDTVKPITLTGSSTMLNELASTANNGNATVQGQSGQPDDIVIGDDNEGDGGSLF